MQQTGPTPGSAADLTPDADPEAVARSIALRQLAAGPRTRAQLAKALSRRGVPDEVARRVLDRFAEVQLIDDAQFADAWVSSRHGGRGLSKRALAHELAQRGVDPETACEALDSISAQDELAAAIALVRKRWPAVCDDDPARRDRRLAGMLARRGYGSAVAFRAIREVASGAGADLEGSYSVGPGDE